MNQEEQKPKAKKDISFILGTILLIIWAFWTLWLAFKVAQCGVSFLR